jgi:hypothetical protein
LIELDKLGNSMVVVGFKIDGLSKSDFGLGEIVELDVEKANVIEKLGVGRGELGSA